MTPTVQLNDGNCIPVIGLGTHKAVKESVKFAIENGYRYIDCAHLYDNQTQIGEAIKECIDDGIVRREQLFISGKVWSTWYGKGRVIAGAKLTLQQLAIDCLDLLLLHWPIAYEDSDDKFWPKDSDGNLILSARDYVDVYKELESVKKFGMNATD